MWKPRSPSLCPPRWYQCDPPCRPRVRCWKWSFLGDLSIRHGDVPWLCYVSLPEGTRWYKTFPLQTSTQRSFEGRAGVTTNPKFWKGPKAKYTFGPNWYPKDLCEVEGALLPVPATCSWSWGCGKLGSLPVDNWWSDIPSSPRPDRQNRWVSPQGK